MTRHPGSLYFFVLTKSFHPSSLHSFFDFDMPYPDACSTSASKFSNSYSLGTLIVWSKSQSYVFRDEIVPYTRTLENFNLTVNQAILLQAFLGTELSEFTIALNRTSCFACSASEKRS